MKKLIVVVLAGCAGIALFFTGPFGMEKTRTASDFLYLGVSVAHVAWAGLTLIRGQFSRLSGASSHVRVPSWRGKTRALEVLAGAALILYIFSYIFATNANMDYVQRFAESSGNLRLAPDSLTERLNSLLRYLPLLLTDFFLIILNGWTTLRRDGVNSRRVIEVFAFPFALISSILYTASIPSFISLEGIGLLAYCCLVPLFLVLLYAPQWWGVFYGTVFGVIQTMLTNHWLGTFSLVSLQLITGVYLILYAVFMTAVVAVFRRFGRKALFFIPFLWIVFDYLRSLGFIGYPWGFLGVSQYRFLEIIQIASITGVWGVTLLVLLANGVLAFLAASAMEGRLNKRTLLGFPVAYAVFFSAVAVFGPASIAAERNAEEKLPRMRVALIQQNADPRKHDYRETFEVLRNQTDMATAKKPDLVVWSETAFVPNIRRWSRMDPARYPYARLVNEFLEYQKSLDVWLLTGNDDYELVPREDGETDRFEYNAAVFFDPAGNRVETYRKIHLVPFTEYFPFKEAFPGFYEWLKNSDVYLWEPGERRVVFEHPMVRFSTPICFEDGFPSDIRAFVAGGAQLIINISNDFWSLTDVEAQQHFANGLFRAVENSRPMLRASASGVTSAVDSTGRVLGRLPFYEEGFLIADTGVGAERVTLYTRFGDWLPFASAGIIVAAFALSFLRIRYRKRRRVDGEQEAQGNRGTGGGGP